MRQLFAWLAGTMVCVSPAVATVTTVIDLLDGSDDGGPSPAGIVVADVYADVSATGQAWTAGGVHGDALHGARLRYALDPNGHPFVNPGLGNRFVTFLSRPYARNSDGRFTQGRAAVAGAYQGPGPSAWATPTYVDVAFFSVPPPTPGSPPIAGYVFRVAIDVTNVTVPGGPYPDSAYRAYRVGAQPAGMTAVFLSDPFEPGELGTVNATFDMPNIEGLNWGIYVPEPATWALLTLAAIVFRRR